MVAVSSCAEIVSVAYLQACVSAEFLISYASIWRETGDLSPARCHSAQRGWFFAVKTELNPSSTPKDALVAMAEAAAANGGPALGKKETND